MPSPAQMAACRTVTLARSRSASRYSAACARRSPSRSKMRCTASVAGWSCWGAPQFRESAALLDDGGASVLYMEIQSLTRAYTSGHEPPSPTACRRPPSILGAAAQQYADEQADAGGDEERLHRFALDVVLHVVLPDRHFLTALLVYVGRLVLHPLDAVACHLLR